MKNFKKYICLASLLLVILGLTGCNSKKVEKPFSYMKESNITKISIQSTRDKSYKFTVTDTGVIDNIYNILSKAKEVDKESKLEADYIFEIYEGEDNIHKFSYIAGLDPSDGANFYDGEKGYIISKRLDNDIIKNFWNIRKPIDFQIVYYDTIIKAISQYRSNTDSELSIGIDLDKDLEMAKFILSTDVMNFENKLNKEKNVQIINDENKDKFDIIMSIHTEGYLSNRYKATITFEEEKENRKVNLYIFNTYEKGDWNFKVLTEKPDDF